jgi:molybdopterin synthase sulfur carrier subunit
MKLKFFATYRNITHCSETDIPATQDVWALLAQLGEQYGDVIRAKLFTPDGSDVGDEAIVLVNGRNILYLNGKHTPLTEADEVSIFPLVAGG